MRYAPSKSLLAFSLWAVAALLLGGVLMSFHQPFQTPAEEVLSLAGVPAVSRWRAIHFLSGSCACSQRVMRHLLQRHRLDGVTEQVILVDGPEPYLPDSDSLAAQLRSSGFTVSHLATDNLSTTAGLRGVPLLVISSPLNHVAYIGGYGPASDQDVSVLQQAIAGHPPPALPIIGCAVGTSLRHRSDPFHLKY